MHNSFHNTPQPIIPPVDIGNGNGCGCGCNTGGCGKPNNMFSNVCLLAFICWMFS